MYLFVTFQKNTQAKFVFTSRPLPFPSKPFRMQILIFQPPNILTPLENGCRSLRKQRGFKRSLCACSKKASPIDFSSFLCYLRQLKFAKARDFAIYTESNFSYCVKSSSATNARLFNTQYGICEIGCPVVTPSQTSLL